MSPFAIYGMVKFRIQLNEVSGEMARAKQLFVKSFKNYLGGKNRQTRLNVIEEVLSAIIADKTELKLLILGLNKKYSVFSKEKKEKQKPKKG